MSCSFGLSGSYILVGTNSIGLSSMWLVLNASAVSTHTWNIRPTTCARGNGLFTFYVIPIVLSLLGNFDDSTISQHFFLSNASLVHITMAFLVQSTLHDFQESLGFYSNTLIKCCSVMFSSFKSADFLKMLNSFSSFLLLGPFREIII